MMYGPQYTPCLQHRYRNPIVGIEIGFLRYYQCMHITSQGMPSYTLTSGTHHHAAHDPPRTERSAVTVRSSTAATPMANALKALNVARLTLLPCTPLPPPPAQLPTCEYSAMVAAAPSRLARPIRQSSPAPTHTATSLAAGPAHRHGEPPMRQRMAPYSARKTSRGGAGEEASRLLFTPRCASDCG